MAAIFKMHEAKTHLSKLVARAMDGEEIVIASGNHPKVKLVPVDAPPKRVFGSMKGQFVLPDSFFDPLPEDELRLWEGG